MTGRAATPVKIPAATAGAAAQGAGPADRRGSGNPGDRRGGGAQGADRRNARPAPANNAMAEALRRAGLVNDKGAEPGKQDRRSNRP